ncbi:class II aldolase/adducin family protein [Blastococcus sp. URHD0036]|uniref:class II aldolase/adducin family protein n=1 Tax=Blastococcus sp. URHD0036 TaxID=1380356 RepID=UPI0004967FEA|nr:class II aldolase/adducin family protein [Blastococcus sp. URHD0036]
MSFVPTADKLIPELTPAQEIVVLARTLWREGYNDHLAGHITYNLGDGTLLCNPWLLTWAEFRPQDVIRIDLEGNLVEGDWPVPLGIPLHLELHRARPGVQVALHNHSQFGTVWADMGEVPPVYDQSSSLGGGDLVLVDEYDGGVDNSQAAAKAVAAMGEAELALLAGHGVFVLGSTIRAVHQRAVALEQRCRTAWMVRASGSTAGTRLPDWYLERSAQADGNRFKGFWEASVRAELVREPTLLS